MISHNRRKFLCALAAIAALSSATLAGAATDPAQQRPNILLIVSEDNGPALGCYSETAVETPALDRLAAQGTRFRRAYVTQAGCSPSRASFLTGLYPHQNGQIGLATWRFQMYRKETPNVASALKQAGYRTGIIGKLHVNPEEAFPFEMQALPSSNFARKGLEDYAKVAEKFFSKDERPFFLAVNYPDAHRPFLRQQKRASDDSKRKKNIKPLAYMGLDSPKLRKDTQNYYECMARLDQNVADLLARLDASGKAENTLVIYIGDHGADLIRGKRTSYEGGVRIPMILRWPGHSQAGHVADELVSTVDLLPTFLDAAKAEKMDHLPGRSLLPLVQGKEPSWRQHLFTEFHTHSAHNYYPQRTVRNERFKLIWNLLPDQVNPGYDFTLNKYYSEKEIQAALTKAPKQVQEAYALMRRPPEFELYDLHEDPYEFKNLADDPAHAPMRDELKATLLAWRKKTKDPFLDPAKVLRLKEEIEATKIAGQYVKKTEPWEYVDYMGNQP